MRDEIYDLCDDLVLLINELQEVLSEKEWLRVGFVMADSIAMLRACADKIDQVEAERDFWAEPDRDDGGDEWVAEWE